MYHTWRSVKTWFNIWQTGEKFNLFTSIFFPLPFYYRSARVVLFVHHTIRFGVILLKLLFYSTSRGIFRRKTENFMGMKASVQVNPNYSTQVKSHKKYISNLYGQRLVSSWIHLIVINSMSRLHLSQPSWSILYADNLTSLCISSTCFITAVSSDFRDKAIEFDSICKFWSASSHCPNMYSNVPLEHYKNTIKNLYIATSEHTYFSNIPNYLLLKQSKWRSRRDVFP